MNCQLYEIINNEIRYIYKGVRGLRQSKTRVTTFTVTEAQKIIRNIPHHKLLIATPGDIHFKKTDKTDYIINLRKGA